jgi:hypothetical protein
MHAAAARTNRLHVTDFDLVEPSSTTKLSLDHEMMRKNDITKERYDDDLYVTSPL